MSKDYYNILGVSKDASKDEIKKAFRTLAHQYHTDKKEGDEKKFKEVNEAYQVLSDDQKRAQYDQFGSAGPGGAGFGGQGFGGFDFSGFQQGNFEGVDIDEIFGSFFGGGFRRVKRGRDLRMSLSITFKESVYGVTKTIKVPDVADPGDKEKERTVEVQIPAGIEHGQQMKVAGYGEVITDGEPGNLYLQIVVESHEVFRRNGNNIVMDLDVKLTDAIEGAQYDIETLEGKKKIKIPTGLESGAVLKLRGLGVQGGMFHKGDLLIKTHIQIPKKLSKEAKKAVEQLKKEGY